MSKLLITVIVLAVVLFGAFFLLNTNEDAEQIVNTNEDAEQIVNTNDQEEIGTENISDITQTNNNNEVKTFFMTGENFKFFLDGVDNPDIRVNKGDTVRVEFSSTQGVHDWVVDEFNAATGQVRDTDGSTFVEFIANEIGTFEYYCSVGQHRANGMKGNLIVE